MHPVRRLPVLSLGLLFGVLALLGGWTLIAPRGASAEEEMTAAVGKADPKAKKKKKRKKKRKKKSNRSKYFSSISTGTTVYRWGPDGKPILPGGKKKKKKSSEDGDDADVDEDDEDGEDEEGEDEDDEDDEEDEEDDEDSSEEE